MSFHLPFEIDLHRLAGLANILEVHFGEADLKVRELSSNTINRAPKGAEWRECWSTFLAGSSSGEAGPSGAELAELLLNRGSKTKRSRIFIRPGAVRLVRADLPEDGTRAGDWIEDHAESILQLPVAPGSLIFDYCALDEGENGTRVEIAFVRQAEVDSALSTIRDAGLTPESVSVTSSEGNGGRAFEFLKADQREDAETHLWRSLFQRTVLASGLSILILLVFHFAFAMYVESRDAEVTESTLEIESAVRDVAVRTAEVRSLEEQLAATREGAHRSQLARSLHDLALSTTPGVRLHKLDIISPPSGAASFTAGGDVPAHAQLAAWLAALDTAHFARGVQLVRSGKPDEVTSGGDAPPRTSRVGFEVKGELRE